MKIELKQAVKYFFSNPSLELVYMEAISNSIDAKATIIDISISIEEFSKPETLKIVIKDNGVGFTDERFEKFSKLLKVEESSHKGIGRLVFLSYFDKIDFISNYDDKERTFIYTNEFDEKSVVKDTEEKQSGTTLTFSNYYLSKVKSYDYLKPTVLKKKILEHFYPRLYLLKQDGGDLVISINLKVDKFDSRYQFESDKQTLSLEDIITLKIENVDASLLDMYEEVSIHYSIKKIEDGIENSIVTALSVDGRTHKMEIISNENIPLGYEIIFLLYSKLFNGQVNESRQELTFDDNKLRVVKRIFQKKVAEILQREIPAIIENNSKTKESLVNTYPHLLGYFEEETIGFIKRDETISKAQDKFFKDQKEVLEAISVSDEIYEKTLEISSRTLTEYILYREVILKKMKAINDKSPEADLHNLIVPKGLKIDKSNFMSSIYSNNAWLLDDKYMTYNTILSEQKMSELIKVITKDEIVDVDDARPDITLVFSNDPDTSEKVDVVIVELKKRDLPLADNRKVMVQLEQRARKLMHLFPNKIQRIWFYGVVEFNDELKLSLYSSNYTPLFSIDTLFYKEEEVMLDLESKIKIPIGVYILSMDALIKDAEVRNSTFLNILKENFREFSSHEIKEDEPNSKHSFKIEPEPI